MPNFLLLFSGLTIILKQLLKGEGGLLQQYAEAGLERLDKGEDIPDQVAFQVQTLWLNRDMALIGLDVEPLCGLAKTVEEAVAPAAGSPYGIYEWLYRLYP